MQSSANTIFHHGKLGQIKGIKATSSLTQFLGVPYATIPQRFSRSHLVTSLLKDEDTDIFDATRPGPSSIQPYGSVKSDASGNQLPTDNLPEDEPQSEDCLNLSITLPDAHIKASEQIQKLPVVIFLHGGAFFLGSGNRPYYNPLPFCTQALERGTPIIFIAINYRLGALGFFHCPEAPDLVPENNGLHDQLIALDWIREFIGDFGGDTKNMTMLGESAGSESISLQALSNQPQASVYRRAIMLSGSPVTMPAKTPAEHGENFKKHAEKLGIKIDETRDMREVVREMIEIDVGAIRDLAFVGAPCSRSTMLPYDKPTMALTRNASKSQKNWAEAQIVSSTGYDGGISYIMTQKDEKRKDHAQVIIHIANDVLGKDQAETLLNIYCINADDTDDLALQKICQFETDIGFFAGSLSMAQSRLAEKTYMQLFDLGNPFEGPLEKEKFATHAWDIVSLLGGYEDRLSTTYKGIISAWRDRILDFIVLGKEPCPQWNHEVGYALFVDNKGVRDVVGEDYMSADSHRRRRLLELAEKVGGEEGCDILWEKVCRRFLMDGK